MDRSPFDAADLIVDRLADMITQALESAQFEGMRQALSELSEAVGQRYSVDLNVTIEVFDPSRSHPLPLVMTGLSTVEGKPPYQTWGDSTPQKYEVDGRCRSSPMTVVPGATGYGTSSSRIAPAENAMRPWARPSKFSSTPMSAPSAGKAESSLRGTP
jgi:hypothetical protein